MGLSTRPQRLHRGGGLAVIATVRIEAALSATRNSLCTSWPPDEHSSIGRTSYQIQSWGPRIQGRVGLASIGSAFDGEALRTWV